MSNQKLTDSEIQLKRVYDWLMDENREPAQTKFTEGWQRNLAKEIEFRLKDELKVGNYTLSEYVDFPKEDDIKSPIIWLEKDTGEGMSVNLEEFFKNEH